MIRVGDTVKRRIKVYDPETRGFNTETMETTVVYIHPERRYYVVEFVFELGERTGRFREAFWMEQKKGDQIVNTERRNRK